MSELTFDELAHWVGAKIKKRPLYSRYIRWFNIYDKNSGACYSFWEKGDVMKDRSDMFWNRTPEQMRQIIIAGGLLDEK